MQVCVRNHCYFNFVGGTSEAYQPQWKPRARAYQFCDSAKYEINAYPMALVGPIAASPYMDRRVFRRWKYFHPEVILAGNHLWPDILVAGNISGQKYFQLEKIGRAHV